MRPRFSIAEATTPRLTFAEDLALYRAVGAEGIGLDERKLRLDEADAKLLATSGLQAAGFFPTSPSILPLPLAPGPDDPRDRIEGLCDTIRRAAKLGPACCVCITGPAGGYEPEQARELVVEGFRTIGRVAADVGVVVAVEAIHASIKDDWTFVATIPEVVALLDDIGDPGIAMAFDIWHLWDTPDVLAHVREHASRCAHLHLDDWREPTRSWCDRVLPGDGIADVRGFLRALDDGGFDGWVDLEVFSDDGTFGNAFPDSLWKADPEGVARRGREQFEELWASRSD